MQIINCPYPYLKKLYIQLLKMQREISSLYTTVLKEIAKKPSAHITEKSIKKLHHNRLLVRFEAVQDAIIDAITEAGRLTDDEVPRSFFSFNTLTRKSLCLKNSKLTGNVIFEIIQSYPNLEVVDVSGCFHADDDCVHRIITSVPNLHRLITRNCRKLSDKTFDCIVSNKNKLQHLHEINVGGNFNMSREGLASLLACVGLVGNLEHLCISGLPVDDSVLTSLSSSCESCRLQSLALGYADVSEFAIVRLLEKAGAALRVLSLAWVCTLPGKRIH